MPNLNEATLYMTIAVALANLKRLKKREDRQEAVFDIVETLISVYRSDEAFMKRVREVAK